MQAYWLYGRYEFALSDYERNLGASIEKCVAEYNAIRAVSSDSRVDSFRNGKDFNIFYVPSFSLKQKYGDTVQTKRTSRIYTYEFSAHELLGIKPGTPLTDEQTERKCPSTVEGIDSIMEKAGIKAEVTLARTDSMVWNTAVDYHKSVFSPAVSMIIPYSQLQGLTACIVSRVNPFDVLPGMGSTLIITLLVSCLLIVCLVLQFSTVLKLSRLDKMRSSFVTTMIHELKRPISTLKMCVSAMGIDSMMRSGEVRKEILAETRNALDNLSAYFSKLRDITFNNVEQIPLNIRSVNLRELFDSVASAAVIPSGKTVEIRNNIDGAAVASADRSHLFNILNNLVENAIKYSGKAVEITAEASVSNETVEIRISDNGNGISSGDLRHIFDRFYRGKASAGEQPGMGLGLAYVKLLTEAHGGCITVSSSEGKGTCFTIKLPQ